MTFPAFTPQTPKAEVITHLETMLKEQGFSVIDKNTDKPWGAYFLINDDQLPLFIEAFFPDHASLLSASTQKLSPKILLVAPHQRLSWQYHYRRAEIWKVVSGPVAAVQSITNEETPQKSYGVGETIQHGKEVRHRLVGLENWAVVAEIWQHIDPQNPSNEEDIVRLQDDFGR